MALVVACERGPAGQATVFVDGGTSPDTLNLDRDNDKVPDALEDPDGDGRVGCCLQACNKVTKQWQLSNCLPLTKDGCGPGQRCKQGKCLPAVDINCARGQSDPRNPHTFLDGPRDGLLPSFVCRPAAQRKPRLWRSKAGDWTLGLHGGWTYTELKVNAGKAAAALDHAGDEVAGFVVSLPGGKDVQQALTDLMLVIKDAVPGGVSVRASGTQLKSHDRYDAVQATLVDLTLPAASDVSTTRNLLVARLLGETPPGLPKATGDPHVDLVLRFTTVRRFAFARDPKTGKLLLDDKGHPKDSGDAAARKLVVIGAVAAADRYKDPHLGTGITVDDLSNGSALATFAHDVETRCESHRAPRRGGGGDLGGG